MGQGFESLQARQKHGGYSSVVERQIVALVVMDSSSIGHPMEEYPSGEGVALEIHSVSCLDNAGNP